MPKDKSVAVSNKKAAAKAQKKAKAVQKTARKEKKKASKSQRDKDDDDDDDLEGILEKMRQEWEAAHAVTEELVEGPPSRRANATLTACPNGNHLWCIGGEYFSDDGKAYFYNDVFRYSPDKDEWRKFVSPTCPGPRSAHSVVASPAGGGKLYLFGGEFSSLHQNSFHHYRDFWIFDIPTHSWERIETKVRPSARSGHRMAMWKHFIVLFGGFYDPGHRTQYLNDTWIFDTQEYKWRQIEFKEPERKPSPRSGFSFLPTPDGIVLYGGYCKEYTKGKRPVGVILDDTWLLKMTLDHALPTPLTLKWERRKTVSSTHTPTARAGCTMALWLAKSTGVMFGGVTDEERGEEGLESVFWNDLYGYQLGGNGRWIPLHLKRSKKKGGGKKKQAKRGRAMQSTLDHDEELEDDDEAQVTSTLATQPNPELEHNDDADPDDPNLTRPMPRYNAMLAVLRNTLYISVDPHHATHIQPHALLLYSYGGIFELGTREYTLDDFYTLQLDKLDRFVCLKSSGIVIPTEAEESSDDEEEGEGSDEDEGEDEDSEGVSDSEDERRRRRKTKGKEKKGRRREVEDSGEEPERVIKTDAKPGAPSEALEAETPVDKDDLRARATAFMGVAERDMTRSAEDVISTPAPGETLATFYARSREYWAQKAHQEHASDSRGKQLRRDGFGLAEARYGESITPGSWLSRAQSEMIVEYKPILEEVEKILAEAGLDEDEMKVQAARDGGGFEAGSIEEFEKMKDFVSDRANTTFLKNRIHAIWYCIPMDQYHRAVLAAEEKFFDECDTGNVPVILVLTKCDALLLQGLAALTHEEKKLPQEERLVRGQENAERMLKCNPVWWRMQSMRYPPKLYVELRDLNKSNEGCKLLIEMTVRALDEETLQMLLVTTQHKNIMLCIEFAMER
ncbi:hypothetical protein JVU11DRAFT_8184 [Chiua virens]|nr:hypothetical protein JVU11DRAFT_8184 [Chiua virens]